MIEIGATVCFDSKVFDKDFPYYPYYEPYKNHKFCVIGVMDGHYQLECISGNIRVDGYVHEDELSELYQYG